RHLIRSASMRSMARSIKLAVIGGDGIGPEVTAEGLKVLDAALAGTDLTIERTEFDLGARRWHATGDTLTDDDLAAISEHDAILLGASGTRACPRACWSAACC